MNWPFDKYATCENRAKSTKNTSAEFLYVNKNLIPLDMNRYKTKKTPFLRAFFLQFYLYSVVYACYKFKPANLDVTF